MSFDRNLDKKFIAALNHLHDDATSWWHILAEDSEVFLAVRHNAINAYARGGSVGRILWDGRAIHLHVNRAYLAFPAKDDGAAYVDLLAPGNPLAVTIITNVSDFVGHLTPIKEIVQTYFGRERQGENLIATHVTEVIDIEAAFDTTSEDRQSETEPACKDTSIRQGRVDLVVVSPEGRIVFTEAKIFANRDIRPGSTPRVCEQLILYHNWIKNREGEIQAAYCRLREYYRSLHGRFFDKRFHGPDCELTVDPIPRLLVYGFDDLQQAGAAPIAQAICRGVEGHVPGFTREHIRFVGDAGNVTATHLL